MMLMDINEIKKSVSEAISARNIQLLANLCLSIAVLMLAIRYVFFEPGAIAIPNAPITESIEVKGDWANGAFKQGHAIAFASLLGNISPQNISFVKQRFLISSSPALRNTVEQELDTQISLIKTRKIKQSFTMEDVHFDESQDAIWVWGEKTLLVPNSPAIKSTWTFEFRIGVNAGMPKITYFNQYKGKPNLRQRKLPQAELIPYLDNEIKDVVKHADFEVRAE